MEKKETFRFGVMGAGNISNKFCDAAEKTEEVCVTAVAARSEERAREFAEKYEIHTYYGNYEEMLQKEKLDGVYIGVVTGMHVQLTELCIRYGIPVLCEKALTGSSEEAERIFKLAEEKKIFVMEGVWSLFFLQIEKPENGCGKGVSVNLQSVMLKSDLQLRRIKKIAILTKKPVEGRHWIC